MTNPSVMPPSLRIFHVDDNPLDRELVRDALEQEGDQFMVTAATSRHEFETHLLTDTYDLVLTDFNILGFEGLQVIDAVTQKDPTLPVIVLTGTGSEEVAVEAMKRGAADYVLKTPRHIRRLPMAIMAAMERKRLTDERLLSEQALQASEEQLRAFARALPDLAFIMDEDGRYVQLLNAPEHLIYSSAELRLGRRVHEILPEEAADQIMGAIRRTLQTSTIQTVEYQLMLPSGLTWFEGRTSPMTAVTGLPNEKRLVVYIARNITTRKHAERLQIEIAKEQEIIALKERFIATASHDFRTPLTIIKMSANMLDTYLESMSLEQQTAKLRQIITQVDNMIQLLDDVLTISKANAGKLDFTPQRIVLRPYCEQIWENFQQMAEKTHRMDFVYDCDEEAVLLDANLTHYILVNLLSNAIKYSPVNGHVRLEVIHDGDTLVFRVSDNGIGIPDEDQAQLFQPFHRAANARGIDGTGLGLSIIKSYVEAHHGRIEFESTANHGTTFTVCLPFIAG